jgi:hypothetical protein
MIWATARFYFFGIQVIKTLPACTARKAFLFFRHTFFVTTQVDRLKVEGF